MTPNERERGGEREREGGGEREREREREGGRERERERERGGGAHACSGNFQRMHETSQLGHARVLMFRSVCFAKTYAW